MKETGRSLFVGALALALSVTPVTQIHAQERSRANQNEAAEAMLAAQRAATAESILAAKEEARGEAFDASIRAGLKTRMETLSMEQLAGLALQGADADIPLALGSVTSDLVYTPVTPCRVFDSRPSAMGPGPIPANGQWNVFVSGAAAPFAAQGGTAGGCGVPIGATSAIINFVTVAPSGPGNIRAWAVANPQPPAPLAAILNYGVVAGLAAIANGIAVPLCNPAATSCTAGDLRLQADTSGTNILGDVVGYFRNPQGATPGTLAAVYSNSALGGGVTAAYAFAGPTVSVPITAGQRLQWVVNKALGSTVAGGAADLDVAPCTQVGAAAIVVYGNPIFDLRAAQNTRQMVGVQHVFAPAAATYTVGMCVRSPTQAANWNNNTNWDRGKPNASADAVIAVTGNNTITINSAEMAKSLNVTSSGGAPLRYMPQHSAGIYEVGDSKPPGLNCRPLRRLNSESPWKILAADMCPPSIEIIDHQLHHAVFGPTFVIAPLQNEPARACAENGHLAIEDLVEADRFIETPG